MQKVLVIFSFLIFILFFPNTANAQEWPDWFSQVEIWLMGNLISDEEFNLVEEYLFDKVIFSQDKPYQFDSHENYQQLNFKVWLIY